MQIELDMKKKKVLVYDSQHCFSRFLKYELKKDFAFDVYKNFKKFDNVIEDYAAILFVVSSDKELYDLIRIYQREISLIISTFNKEIKLKLEKIDDILLLDLSKVKSEMRSELKFFLNNIS
ncbi:hypothetical protein ACHRVK_09965 [Flavobacterium plurextorum]|uniref:hypothetical protein n=1 Tax=Flavobacterium plurextorum TaxID=1114867 RepID=UPI003757E537